LDTPCCLCGRGKPMPSGVHRRWRADLGDLQEGRKTGRMERHRQRYSRLLRGGQSGGALRSGSSIAGAMISGRVREPASKGGVKIWSRSTVGRDGRALFETQRTLRETDAQSSGSDARIRDIAVFEPTRRGFRYVLIAHSSAAFRASSTASFFLRSAISLRIACNSLWDFLLTRYSEPSCATMYRSS
jgi:hypothetical protein